MEEVTDSTPSGYLSASQRIPGGHMLIGVWPR